MLGNRRLTGTSPAGCENASPASYWDCPRSRVIPLRTPVSSIDGLKGCSVRTRTSVFSNDVDEALFFDDFACLGRSVASDSWRSVARARRVLYHQLPIYRQHQRGVDTTYGAKK